MVAIAVVDDDPVFTELVLELLHDRGWEARSYHSVSEAVDGLAESPPDVIMVDIRMESVNAGWDLIEWIDSHPALRSLPLILCSAATRAMEDRADWMVQRGVAALPKPFDIDDLYSLIDGLVDR